MAKETENLKLSLYDPTEDKDVKVKDVINNVLGYANSNTTKIDAKFKGVDDNIQILHDYILDSDGNVIFYSKAAVDKMLAKKLDIKPTSAEGLGSGLEVDGAGKLGTSFYNRGHVTNANEAIDPGWYSIPADATNAPLADAGQILSFSSTGHIWPCQIFLSSSTSGIHFRTFDGANWGAWMAAGVVASGSNYVRFGDGTQICWGLIKTPQLTANQYGIATYFNFPVAFANTDYGVASCFTFDIGWGGGLKIHSSDLATTGANIKFMNTGTDTIPAGSDFRLIFIGRWK